MGKQIIKIDDEKCNGCQLCISSCHKGAIAMVNGKAKLVREDCCDGLGNCLSVCPMEAISKPVATETMLSQWPVQIKLVPVNAPFFENANLLVSADCAAYAYGNFHQDFMQDKITLIGCPKLDEVDYSEKLTAILKGNNIKSVMVVRMELHCCEEIENAVKKSLQNSGKAIQWQIETISTNGQILEESLVF